MEINELKIKCEAFIRDLQEKFNQNEFKSKFLDLDEKSHYLLKKYKKQNIFSDFNTKYCDDGFIIEVKTKERNLVFGILYFEALKDFCKEYDISSSLGISNGVYIFKYNL